MKRFLFIPIAILLLMAAGPELRADHYSIRFHTAAEDSSGYVLSMWKWGKKVCVDTVQARKGKFSFEGKTALECGDYMVHRLPDNRKAAEFIVPEDNRNFRIAYQGDGERFLLKQGNGENLLFREFQDLIDTGWKELENAEDFATRLAGLRERAEAGFPGSLTDIILRNALFAPESAEEILENFPFGDTVIINTQFGKDKVRQYLGFVSYNPNDTIVSRVDDMIAKGENARLQNLLAGTAFDYFQSNGIMGQEGVAVRIAEEWYLSGKLRWPSEEGLFMLRTFVEFNRSSLIGMQAPELALTDTLGQRRSLTDLCRNGEYTVLYFYTDDCAVCSQQTPQLVDFINEYKGGVLNVYAVYTQDNVSRWKDYVKKEFTLYNPFVNWLDVYDPDYSSRFHILYNVIQTPQMFLMDKNGTIIGRGLNVEALKQLIEGKDRQRDDLRKFIGDFFAPLASDTAAVQQGIDLFYANSKDKPELFRELFGELMIQLGTSPDYRLQTGAAYAAEKYITGMPELWDTASVENAGRALHAFNMNRLGHPAADLALERADKSPVQLKDIGNQYKILYFYRPNCGLCGQVTPALAKIYNEFKEKMDLQVVAVNLASDYNEWIRYISSIGADWENVRGCDGDSSRIYSSYWLENVPSIYLLKDGVVVAKDINNIDLLEILNNTMAL